MPKVDKFRSLRIKLRIRKEEGAEGERQSGQVEVGMGGGAGSLLVASAVSQK